MAATVIEMPRPRDDRNAEATASTPETRADFHRCGNRLGSSRGCHARSVAQRFSVRGSVVQRVLQRLRVSADRRPALSFTYQRRRHPASVPLLGRLDSRVDGPKQKEEATVLAGCQDRRRKLWRIAAVFAATGALVLSGCASNTERAANRRRPRRRRCGREGRRDREHRSRGHQVVRQADRRGQHSLHAQRVQGPERQDRRLRRRSDERDRLHARPDRRVPRGGLRQDHPVDPGRHLQRRHVVVHRHQGARGSRSTSSPTSRRASCGRSSPDSPDRPEQRVRQEGRGAGHHDRGDRRTARQEQGVHRRGQAGDRDREVRRAGRGHQRRGARPGRRDVGGLAGDRCTRSSRATASSRRRARSSTRRPTAGRWRRARRWRSRCRRRSST